MNVIVFFVGLLCLSEYWYVGTGGLA